jgi:probable selenium-dependent hydroxylase accessory protein YqeC
MRLSDALRIQPSQPQLIAFVGAGGKTTAMAKLGRELATSMRVLLSTTTKLGVGQETVADSHMIVKNTSDLDTLMAEFGSSTLILLTGPKTEDGKKWVGLSQDFLENLRMAISDQPMAILVEADGARQRSIKVPADHEPVIPVNADMVLVIVGLDALDQPMDANIVHRPRG